MATKEQAQAKADFIQWLVVEAVLRSPGERASTVAHAALGWAKSAGWISEDELGAAVGRMTHALRQAGLLEDHAPLDPIADKARAMN